ncbi:hypothetical protein LINPERHAP1_LOCUS27773 [Linum perenne]
MYCLAGWEGSAHDGRVLRDALSRPNGLRVPKDRRPQTPEEYYNMKHSGARNVIERAFGRIVHACCLLHNFIKQEVGVDDIERAYNRIPLSDPPTDVDVEEAEDVVTSMQPSPE